MNRAELRAYVSTELDDLNNGYFTVDYINSRLNLALLEVQKMLVSNGQNYYVICAQTPLVINQQDYVLPGDFLKLSRLEIIQGGTPPNESTSPVGFITLNQQDLLQKGVGVPQNYTIKKNRLVLFPAPDSTYQMRMYYSYRVPQMTNDFDIPDVPSEHHEMIAIIAVISGLLRDGRDPAPFMAKKTEFEANLKANAAQRNVDQSRVVVYTGEYDGVDGRYW